MSVVDKNLDTITYAISLSVKGVIMASRLPDQGSFPVPSGNSSKEHYAPVLG